AEKSRAEGQTIVMVTIDGMPAGFIAIADPVRASTAEAIRRLRAEGLRVVMLTGDNRRTAEAIARAVGIDEVRAEVMPAEKQGVVRELERSGRLVAMAGDGIN